MDALAEVNGGRAVPKVAKFALFGLLLLIVLALGAVTESFIGSWWTQHKLDQQNMYLTFRIIQYNLDQHTLQMPPELSPPAKAPEKH